MDGNQLFERQWGVDWLSKLMFLVAPCVVVATPPTTRIGEGIEKAGQRRCEWKTRPGRLSLT